MDTPLGELKAEIEKGSALVVVGAGVSAGATEGEAVATWVGLLKSGVQRCVKVATDLPDGWETRTLAQIDSGDSIELVLAAQNIAERLGAPRGGEFRKWLRETVGELAVKNSATIDAIRGLNLPIATTNYDGLLSLCTNRPPVTWRTVKACQAAATALLARRDRNEISLAADWLCSNANPTRLSAMASCVIEILADALTQEQINSLFQWLMQRCFSETHSRVHDDTCRRAWRALSHIAIQLEESDADRLCESAMKHRFWMSFDVERKVLRKAVGNCLAKCSDEIKNKATIDLADAVLANDSKTNDDYLTTINLLAYACSICSDDTKKHVESKVYPKGTKLTPELILIAPSIVTNELFGDGIDDWVEKVTKELKLEVQHVKKGESPVSVSGSMMQYTINKPDGGIHLVHIRSEAPIKAALARHKNISAEVFDNLLLAIESSIADPDNLFSNRIALVQTLTDSASSMSCEQASRVTLGTGRYRYVMQTISTPLSQSSYRGGGGRIASDRFRETQEFSREFLGLDANTNRYDLLLLVKQVGKDAGFTPRMIALLEYYVVAFTRDIDWEEGSRPIVFQSLSRSALEMGVSERQIQQLEKQLFDVGAITWHDSGNHKRFGSRDPASGRLLFAYGVDLTPLASLKTELEDRLHQKQLYAHA